MSEERKVQHDGVRNFFGGRNMIIGSISPVTAIASSMAVPRVGIARAGITMLSGYPEECTVDTATIDFAMLPE